MGPRLGEGYSVVGRTYACYWVYTELLLYDYKASNFLMRQCLILKKVDSLFSDKLCTIYTRKSRKRTSKKLFGFINKAVLQPVFQELLALVPQLFGNGWLSLPRINPLKDV